MYEGYGKRYCGLERKVMVGLVPELRARGRLARMWAQDIKDTLGTMWMRVSASRDCPR